VYSLFLFILALAGLLISSYFSAVAFRWIRPDADWIPRFCQLQENTCATLVFTPRARLFGVPNSLLGQLFYLAIIVGLLEEGLMAQPYVFGYLLVSFLTVLMGIFLTYSLLFLTRVPCTLCFTSHLINLLIFILFLLEL